MAEPVPLYRGLADYLGQLVDLSKSDKKLNAAIKELAKNMPVANGISKAKQLENAVQCLEAAKDFASEHDKQAVFNKLIKKRKKAKSVDTNLEHACKDLLNALNIVHIAILGATQPESAKTERTVLWVDDHPENNKDDVAKAKKDYHVSVVQRKSTEEAMDYVKSKADKLKNAPSSQFRIVTDFYRDDEKEKAAESLIQSLRDDGWKCPVLIYCGEQSNVINLLAENSNVTVTTSDTLLYLYFETMSDAGKKQETKPEKDEMSEEHTEEMPKSEEEEKPAAKKKSDLKSSKDLKKAGSNVSNKSTKSNKSAKAAEESEEKEEATPPKKSVKKSSSNLSATSNKSAKSGTTAKAESEDEASEKEEKQDSPPPKKDVKKTSSNLSSTSNKSTKSNKLVQEESDEEKEPEPAKPAKEVKKTSSSLSSTSTKSNKLVKEDSDEEKEEEKEVKKSTSNLSNKSKKEEEVKPAAKVAEKKDLKSSTGSASSKGSKLSDSNDDKESKKSPVVETKAAAKPELLKKTASGLSAGKGNKIGEDDESDDVSPMSSPISAKKSSLLNPNLKKLTNSAEKKEKEPAKPPVKLERDESASYTSRPEAVNSLLKLESDAYAGHVCVLSVQVKDQFNTNFKEGGDFVEADFKGPALFEGYVEDNNDGTYKISFFPTRTGSYKAHVKINSTDVKNSPFAFVAKEAPKNKSESKPQSPEPVQAAQKKRKLDEMEVDKQEEPAAKKSKITPAATSTNKPTTAKAQEDAKLMPPPKAAASAHKKKEKSDEEKSDDDTYWLMDADDSPKKQKHNLNSTIDSSVDKSVDTHNSSHEKAWDDEGGMEPTLRLDDDDAFPIPPPRNVGQGDNEIEPTLKLDDDDWQIPKPHNMDIDENAPTQLLM